MKHKKGFTLIELLAVIVVLAILLVIAIPSILSRLDLVKRKAVVLYANKVYDAASTRYVNDTIKDDVGEIQWYSLSDLKMTDDKYEGYARIDKCSGKNRISIYVWDDEYKLVSGELKVENVENVEISPKDELEAIMLTTNTCNNLNSYNITYKYTDGTNTYVTNPVSIRNGTKINLPNKIPSNATGLYGNYIITGWKYGSETLSSNPTYTYLEDVELEAILEPCGNGYTCETGTGVPVNYNITYNNTCGNVNNPSTYNVTNNITLNNPSKTGYTFNGWYEGTASPVTPYSFSNQTGDKVINASCTPQQYDIVITLGVGVQNVSYNVNNGGTAGIATSSNIIKANFDETYELETRCKSGYASPTASISGTMSTAEISYSASCTPTSYTCAAGTYLPKNGTSCTTCTAGSYCTGGTYTFSTTTDQGITACASGYTSSAGASSCVVSCTLTPGKSYSFSYTGGVQTFAVPCVGLYKLEVWGAASSGGGGYSVGYKVFTNKPTLSVVCGGRPYNGGGNGRVGPDPYDVGSSGGGATHIATTNRGVLSNYNSYRSEVLIVAGGGGGAGGQDHGNNATEFYQYGGSGGGTSGTRGDSGGAVGTQTSGYAFGQGGSGSSYNSGGGGGGWYGGGAGATNPAGGSGGSGYIGGVPAVSYNGTTYSPSTSTGGNSGNGRAVITYLG